MQGAEPSYGYSVLAQIMSSKQHKVAVTTNFDNLVADAISTYTHDYPLVCGHESLTGFIRPNLKRPVIAKIHRDLLLNPKSEPEEIEKLPPQWEEALQVIFDNNTPIVIGYGGNDGSLMGFFKRIKPIKGGIFWCYRVGKEPDQKIQEIVKHHQGRLVPILGFDELMLQLWEKLQLPSPIPDLQKTHDKRVVEFQRQFEELNKKLKQPGETKAAEAELKEVRAAADAAVDRLTKEKNWWAWQLKVNADPDPDKKEVLYREALKDFPKSVELMCNLAILLYEEGKKHDEVEQLYCDGLILDPKSVNMHGNFAMFMESVRKDYDEAERLYRRALELDPKHANITGNFASFMNDARKNYDEAERLYRKALELNPKHLNHTGNFAIFMTEIRKNYDEGERLYRKAMELDPKNATRIESYAKFLWDVRKNHDESERHYRKALELNPKDVNIIGGFAVFMYLARKNNGETEKLCRKALELDPKHPNNNANFAFFNWKERKDYDEAERLYRKAIELGLDSAFHANNFAKFMEEVRKNFTEANRLFLLALKSDPNFEDAKIEYTRFLKEHPKFSK
jgi:tetratricopeptide (TPR) repeat protein